MSWARDEWKDGLPHKVLQKIEAMEGELERDKRDKQQKQYQIDSVQAMLNKQKQIAESERAQAAASRREAQTLAENCENLERAKRKALQDISQRDARYAAVEDQLKRTRAMLEAETNQKAQIKSEMERQAGKLLESERSVRDLQLHSQKLSSIERKFQDLQTRYQQETGASQKTERQLRDQMDRQGMEKQRVEHQLAEMNRQVHNVKESNVALESSVKELKMQMSSFEREKKELMKRADGAEARSTSKDRTISDLERRQQESKSLLEQKNGELKELVGERDKMTNENEKLAVEIEAMKKHLADAEKRKRELEEMGESFNRDMHTKRQEALEMIGRIEDLEMQLLNAKEENESRKEKVERLENEVKEATDRCNLIEIDSKSSKKDNEATATAASSELVAMSNQLCDYQRQVDTLLAEKSQMSLSLDNLNETVKRLRHDLQEKDRKYKLNCQSAEIDIDCLNGKVEDLQKELNEVTTQRDIAHSLASQKETARQNLAAELEQAKSSLKKLEELEGLVEEKKVAVTSMTESNALLKSSIETAQLRVSQLEREVCESERMRREVCDRMGEMERELMDKERQVTDMRLKVEMADETVKKHRMAAQKAQTELVAFQDQVVSSQANTQSLTSHILDLESEISTLKSSRDALQTRLHDKETQMTKENQSQRDVILELRDHVTKLEETCERQERQAKEKIDGFSQLKQSLEARIESMNAEMVRVRSELDSAGVAMETLSKEKEELERKLRDERDKFVNLEAEQRTRQETHETTLSDLRETIGSLQQEVGDRDAKMERMQCKFSTEKATYESQMRDRQSAMNELQTRVEALTLDREKAMEEKAKIEEEIEAVRDELTCQKAEGERMRKKQSDIILGLQERLSRLQTSYNEEQDSMARAEKEFSSVRLELEAQINEMTQSCQSVRRELEAVLLQRHDATRDNEELERQVRELSERLEMEELESEKMKREGEARMLEMRESLSRMQETNREIEKAKKQAEGEMAAIRSELGSQIEELTRERDDQCNQVEVENAAKIQTLRENEELKRRVTDLERELANQEACIIQVESDRDSELSELQARLSDTLQCHEAQTEVLKQKEARLTSQLVDIKDHMAEIEHEKACLHKELEQMTEEKRKLLEDREEIEEKVTELKEKVVDGEAKMRRQQETVQFAERERQQMEQEFDELKRCVGELEDERETMREASDRVKSQLHEKMAGLQQRCVELQHAKSTVSEEIDMTRAELSSQVTQLTREVTSLQTRLASGEAMLADRDSEIDSLRRSAMELDELREADRERQRKVVELEEMVAVLNEELADKEDAGRQMEKDVTSTRRELETETREKEEMVQELKDQAERAEKLQRDRDELEERLREVRGKLEVEEAVRQEGEKEIDRLREELETQLRDMTAGTNMLCDKLEVAEEAVREKSQLEEEIVSLRRQVDVMDETTRDKDRLREEVDDLRLQVDAMDEMVRGRERLREEVDELQRRLDVERLEHEKQRELEKAELSEMQSEQERQARELEDTRQQLEEQLSLLRAENETQLEEISKLSAMNETDTLTCRQTISELQTDVDRLQQSLTEREDSTVEMSSFQANLEVQLSLLSAESASLHAELEAALAAKQTIEEELRQTVKQLTAEKAENERQKGEQDKAIVELENRMEDVEEVIGQHKAARAELEARLTNQSMESQKTVESKEKMIAELQSRVMDLQGEYNKLQSSLKPNQVRELREKVDNMNSEISSLQEQAEMAMFGRDELCAQKEDLEETVVKLKNQLVAMETEVSRTDDVAIENEKIKQEMEEVRCQLTMQEAGALKREESLNDVMVDIKQQLCGLESVLTEKESSLRQLESRSEAERVDLEMKLKEAKAECDLLHACVVAKEKMVYDAEELVEKLKGERDEQQVNFERQKEELERVVSDLRDRLSCLQKAYSEQEDATRHAEKEFASARADLETNITKLSRDIESLQAERNKAVVARSETSAEKDALEKMVNMQKTRLIAMETELTIEKEKQQESEKEFAAIRLKLEGRIDAVQEESNRLSSEYQSVLSQLQETRTLKRKQEGAVIDMRARITRIESQQVDWENKSRRWQEERREMEERIERQKADLDDVTVAMKQANEEKALLEIEIQRLQESVENGEALEKELSSLKARNATIATEINNIIVTMQQVKEEKEALEVEVQAARRCAEETEALRKEVCDLKARNSKSGAEMEESVVTQQQPVDEKPTHSRYHSKLPLKSPQSSAHLGSLTPSTPSLSLQPSETSRASRLPSTPLVDRLPHTPTRPRRYQLRSSKKLEPSQLPQRVAAKNWNPPAAFESRELPVRQMKKGLLKQPVTRSTGRQAKAVHWKDELAENSQTPCGLQSSLHSVRVITPDSPSPVPLKQSNFFESPHRQSPLVLSVDKPDDDSITSVKSPGKRTLYSKAKRETTSFPSQPPAKKTKLRDVESRLPTPQKKLSILDLKERPECKTQ